MSKAPQKAIILPVGWRIRFNVLAQEIRGSPNIDEFMRQPPAINNKTLDRAEESGEMTVRYFRFLVDKLAFQTDDELLAALRAHPATDSLDFNCDDHKQFLRRYRALARDGTFDEALTTAKEAFKRAKRTNNVMFSAYWSNRIATAYRDSGNFVGASSYYVKALSYIKKGFAANATDLELIYLLLTTRFGRIITHDFRINGALQTAYAKHSALLAEGENLLSGNLALSDEMISRFRYGRTDIRRQQAKMLFLMGRYKEAMALIKEVYAEYPDSQYERRSYAKLLEADIHRLTGDLQMALLIYSELKKLARDRDWPGLRGAVLVREYGALQLFGDTQEKQRAEIISELVTLPKDYANRYRVVALYSRLVGASGKVNSFEDAFAGLREAERIGPIKPTFMRMEAAHVSLCRAELLRSEAGRAHAHKYFQDALASYSELPSQWGMVRAWIGVQLTGKSTELPAQLESVEGSDAELLARFMRDMKCPGGLLSMNLP